MKNVLMILALLVSASAFAGTEIRYLPAFNDHASLFKNDDISQIEVVSASLVSVPTQVQDVEAQCGGDGPSDCTETRVLASTQAVEVKISYFNSRTAEFLEQDLHLEPAKVPASTLAVLSKGGVAQSRARALFAVKAQEVTQNVPSVDEAASDICTGEAGTCTRADKIVYKQVDVQMLDISVAAR